MARLGVPFEFAIVASEIGSYKPALGHWRASSRARGRPPRVHVAASHFHDVAPANELGLPRSGSTGSASGRARSRRGSCRT